VFLGNASVLKKYKASYFQCSKCGFIAPDNPIWLEESYEAAITKTDIGLIERNITYSQITECLIGCFFNAKSKFIDYGGGYGILVRLMRDRGFDFYRQDMYCDNLFATGFDISDAPDKEFEILTAFEVFEHLVNPLEEVGKMLKFSKNIFFSTELAVNPALPLDQWSYYGLEHGQHVALYTRQSLLEVAKYFGKHLITNGSSLHLLAESDEAGVMFQWITKLKMARILNGFLRVHMRPKSFLEHDYLVLKDRLNNENFS